MSAVVLLAAIAAVPVLAWWFPLWQLKREKKYGLIPSSL